MAGRILWRHAYSGTGFLVGIWSICLWDALVKSLALVKIPGPHACTPAATHSGSSTHFSISCTFVPSHFPVAPRIIHTFHTSRRPASRDRCEARDIHVCRTLSHVIVRALARLPQRPARGADRPTPTSPVAGTKQRTLPTTRQALLTYSHAKCLSSRLTVTSRRRRHGGYC